MTSVFFGTPGAIRTHDLRLRKPTLYPAELRVQIIVIRVHSDGDTNNSRNHSTNQG